MHRKPLLEELAVYRPYDAREAQMTAALAAFVAAHTDCFERSLLIGHVTASAWVIDRQRSSALLTHHRKLNKWLQLGGHADGDPDVLAVAAREVREESGLAAIQPVSEQIFDIDIHTIPARGSEPEHLHYDVRFLLQADPRAPLTVSEESRSLMWVPLDRIGEFNAEESMLRVVVKIRRLQNQVNH
jgi:8-oxo-dGTP pyrophosphatase MutT (NUDIX family)